MYLPEAAKAAMERDYTPEVIPGQQTCRRQRQFVHASPRVDHQKRLVFGRVSRDFRARRAPE
jgi:hypothetical protein